MSTNIHEGDDEADKVQVVPVLKCGRVLAGQKSWSPWHCTLHGRTASGIYTPCPPCGWEEGWHWVRSRAISCDRGEAWNGTLFVAKEHYHSSPASVPP